LIEDLTPGQIPRVQLFLSSRPPLIAPRAPPPRPRKPLPTAGRTRVSERFSLPSSGASSPGLPRLTAGGAHAPPMARGEHQTTEALLDVLGDFRVALPTPSLGHGGSNPEGLLPGRRGEDGTQVCNKLLACQCAHCGEKFYLSS